MERSKLNLNLLFLLSLFLWNTSYSQSFSEEEQNFMDSLNTIIENPKSHDTSLVKAYVDLSDMLSRSDMDTMKTLCEEARIISEKALDRSPSPEVKKSLLYSLAVALNNIGHFFQMNGDIQESLENHFQSLKIREEIGDKAGIAMSLNAIGYSYEELGDIPKALEFYHRSLKIEEEIENKAGVANSLNSIGYTYLHQGDMSLALDYYLKSLKIYQEIEDKNGMAYLKSNIGEIYITKAEQSDEQGRDSLLTKALKYNLEALSIREELGYKRAIANSFNNLGSIYKLQGDIPKALNYYHQCKDLSEEIGFTPGVAYSLINIGKLEFKMNKLIDAEKHVSQSLDLLQQIGFPDGIKRAAKLLSEIYEKQNKGMQALEMRKLYVTMKDSINNEETQRATAQQQAKYEYEKQKVIDDAENDKLLAIEQEEKEKQQLLTVATASVLLLVMVFLYFVFNRLKITRKQKMVIEEQKLEVEKQRDVIEDAHKEITDSIAYAKRIQSAILPPPRIVKEYLEDSFILYTPKDVVAGDFYWMRNQDDKILFAAADCTGHGVPGAMVSVVCNMALNRAVREYGLTDPGEILDMTRSIVVREFEKSDEEVKDGMDIALCTLKENKLQYAGAYNPLWIVRNEEILETKADRWPIGLSQDPKPYTTHSIDLEKGDVIYIFTDGFVDQFGGENGKKLKVQGLKKLLLSMHDKPMEDQRKLLNDSFFNWMGNLEQVDDVCLIGVRV